MPLSEFDLGQALRALRDWAGLTQQSLAAKHTDLSDSTISARELGRGLPSKRFVDAFVPTCLHHVGGFTPQEIIDELAHWTQARNNLEKQLRAAAITVPTPHPPPAVVAPVPEPDLAPSATSPAVPEPAPPPVALDDYTEPTAPEGADHEASPEPAPSSAPTVTSRLWARLRHRWRLGIGVALAVIVVVVLAVLGLAGLHGPRTTAEVDRRSSQGAATPTQPLVQSPPYAPGKTYTQIVNSAQGARTYAKPSGMAGEGPRIGNHTTVQVSCKVVAPGGDNGSTSVGTYWYRIVDPPWSDRYYSPTNSFLNDDPISGTHEKIVDEKVPYCPS